MLSEPLSVVGAYLFRPQVHADQRGAFVTTFPGLTRSDGRSLQLPIAQASFGRSRQHVARGIHYTTTPPGCAKLAWCTSGAVLDLIVDTRVGSPTFGQWDTVELEPTTSVAVYLPVGVGHAYVAHQDETVVNYLLTTGYVPENEKSINLTDPDLALALPTPIEPILSDRDRTAPTLAQAQAAGALPAYDRSVELDEQWWT